jgi:hypothetical protein
MLQQQEGSMAGIGGEGELYVKLSVVPFVVRDEVAYYFKLFRSHHPEFCCSFRCYMKNISCMVLNPLQSLHHHKLVQSVVAFISHKGLYFHFGRNEEQVDHTANM